MKRIIMLLLFIGAITASATVGSRNNNPGNVKKPGSDTWNGTVGYDQYGHVQFKSLDYGVRALYKNFKNRAARCPEMSLGHYFGKVYAEENGLNEARYIVQSTSVASVDCMLKDINLTEMVSAVAWFESRMVITPAEVQEVVNKFNL